jgi:hypothetical protein
MFGRERFPWRVLDGENPPLYSFLRIPYSVGNRLFLTLELEKKEKDGMSPPYPFRFGSPCLEPPPGRNRSRSATKSRILGTQSSRCQTTWETSSRSHPGAPGSGRDQLMILLLKIEGKCLRRRAKPAHLGGHLPASSIHEPYIERKIKQGKCSITSSSNSNNSASGDTEVHMNNTDFAYTQLRSRRDRVSRLLAIRLCHTPLRMAHGRMVHRHRPKNPARQPCQMSRSAAISLPASNPLLQQERLSCTVPYTQI